MTKVAGFGDEAIVVAAAAAAIVAGTTLILLPPWSRQAERMPGARTTTTTPRERTTQSHEHSTIDVAAMTVGDAMIRMRRGAIAIVHLLEEMVTGAMVTTVVEAADSIDAATTLGTIAHDARRTIESRMRSKTRSVAST